jgi:hypothetical protein
MEKFELLNNYLNSKLDPEALKKLESALESDSELRNLLEHESAIKTAVSQQRISELKQRMDSVSLKTSSSSYLKLAASVALIGFISFGGYHYYNKNNLKTTTEIKNNNFNNDNNSIVEKPTIRGNSIEEESKKKESLFETKKSSPSAKTEKAKAQNDAGEQSTPVLQEHDLNHDSPSVFNNEENTTNNDNSFESIPSGKLEVIMKSNSSSQLSYKHFNSKLYLEGNFHRKYEVIEIATNEIYLKYNGNYYFIEDGVETLTPLQKISDIEQIKIINNKIKKLSE